jgi:hypothetical protein
LTDDLDQAERPTPERSSRQTNADRLIELGALGNAGSIERAG